MKYFIVFFFALFSLGINSQSDNDNKSFSDQSNLNQLNVTNTNNSAFTHGCEICFTNVFDTLEQIISRDTSAQAVIISNGKIQSGNAIEYYAGKEIKLIDRFEVEIDATFHAYISPCFSNPEQHLQVDMSLIDDAMGIPVPFQPGSYSSAGGSYYGRNAPLMLFLTLLAYDDPTRTDSGGASVMARALEHLHAAVSEELHPLLRAGHSSWFDMFVPVALGIARQTPAMWNTFSTAERQRADLLMRHSLHAANIFLNTNSASGDRSRVLVDMAVTESGSVPNQSASFHAFGIGAYLYFGGEAGMTAALAAYDVDIFRSELRAVGFDDIANFYDNDLLQRLFEGESINPRAQPDPQGVRKPLLMLNTLSLENSAPGKEHPYFGANPLPATPTGIFQRWGHDFAVGCMPQGNVGPSAFGTCNGADMGLANGTMPFEGIGKGMPYEFNLRSSSGGPHTRSSWDYSAWGMQQYSYLFAALAVTGYWDETNALHQEIITRACKATQIWRYVGENKWLSSSGPPSTICTTNHGTADAPFSGSHWVLGLMDGLFSDPESFKLNPLVP